MNSRMRVTSVFAARLFGRTMVAVCASSRLSICRGGEARRRQGFPSVERGTGREEDQEALTHRHRRERTPKTRLNLRRHKNVPVACGHRGLLNLKLWEGWEPLPGPMRQLNSDVRRRNADTSRAA